MPPTIHRKYKYFHSTVQTAEDRRQKFIIWLSGIFFLRDTVGRWSYLARSGSKYAGFDSSCPLTDLRHTTNLSCAKVFVLYR